MKARIRNRKIELQNFRLIQNENLAETIEISVNDNISNIGELSFFVLAVLPNGKKQAEQIEFSNGILYWTPNAAFTKQAGNVDFLIYATNGDPEGTRVWSTLSSTFIVQYSPSHNDISTDAELPSLYDQLLAKAMSVISQVQDIRDQANEIVNGEENSAKYYFTSIQRIVEGETDSALAYKNLAEKAANDAVQAISTLGQIKDAVASMRDAVALDKATVFADKATVKGYVDDVNRLLDYVDQTMEDAKALSSTVSSLSAEFSSKVSAGVAQVDAAKSESIQKFNQIISTFNDSANSMLDEIKQQRNNAEEWARRSSEYAEAAALASRTAGASSTEAKKSSEDAKGFAEEAERQAEKSKRYYKPYVDEDGNLHWESTKEDMDPIPPQNIYGNTIVDALREVEEIKSSQGVKFGYAEYSEEDYFIHFYNEKGGDEIGVVGPVRGGTGSGGGTSASSTILLNAVDFGSSKTIAYGRDCILTFRWESTTASGPTGDGSLTVNVGGRNVILDRDIKQGTVSVNVKDYLAENATNTVKITVRDLYGSTSILVCRIKAISFYLYAPQFHEDEIQTGAFLYSFYPYGEGDKTVHVVVDGTDYTKSTNANGRPESIEIPALSHGVHSIEAWFESTINDMAVECDHLKYQIIATEEGHSEPIIAMRAESELLQYYTSTIRYQVWTNRQLSSVVLDDGVTQTAIDELDKTEHNWSVRKDEVGEAVFKISVGDYTKELRLNVRDSGIVLTPATSNLEVYLSSRGHVVGSPLEWGYEDIQCQFNEDEFTAACGWQMDKDNIPVMRLKGAARMTVPFKIFGKEVSVNGKTIEIEFATSNVFDYDTVVMDCMSGGRGFEATAQAVTLKSSENELYTQYKEDEHVRISFVISSAMDPTQGKIVYCYINGIMSGAYQYSTDLFEQIAPEDLVIGSDSCTTDVYCLRIYDRALDKREIIDNWIADMQNGAELVKQYESNDIYVNDRVSADKLLSRKLPCLVIIGDLPQDKGDVKTVSGYYTDPEDSSKSFDFSGAEIDVQGTSSKDYAVKNYKIKFNGGFKLTSGTTVAKYAIEGGMPVDTFTFKADYASSEGANNVELVRLYNDIDPYRSPLQEEDTRVRQGIDGFPIAIFHQSEGGTSTFVGKYNFNNDKGTAEVFGFEEGDQSWEITGNGASSQLFKSADFNTYADVHEDFEARYPKEPKVTDPQYTDPAFVADLKAMISWVASTDTTVEGLSESEKTARLEKFKTEFDQWFDRDSTFFYYIFTEFFLMVDSRAKNAFPTKYDADGKWSWLPYDMDTALGIDNGGRLMFSYNLEDTDVINGATVYNGQNSVLWNNLRECFGDELEEFYETMVRNNSRFNYDSIEGQFEDHQNKWPVALWNEDSNYKYIDALVNKNDNRLYMLQGSKESQRKWWLFNRFRYIDSKYTAGLAKQKTIVFRAYANNMGDHSEFEIKPYADIYARVDFDEKHDKVKADRGETTTLRIDGIDNPNNLVVRIYSADQLASVGDISGFLPDEVKLGDAVNLQSIKVGDEGFNNPQLKSLELGANALLKTIDARNCVNLNTPVNASGCESIEEIYLDNTNVPSVSLPVGAPLRTLHLPETITSLELRYLTKLDDFVIEGNPTFSRLWSEQPPAAIAKQVTDLVIGMPVGSRVRVRGLDYTTDNEAGLMEFLRKMERLKGLDENGYPTLDKAQISGNITLNTSMNYGDLVYYNENYPDLTIVPTAIIYRISFYSEDGETLLLQKEVNRNDQVPYTGLEPSKESDNYYTYSFVGWSETPNSEGSTVQLPIVAGQGRGTYYAYFWKQTRLYSIKFVNDDGSLLQELNLPYDALPVYTGDTPITTDTTGDWGTFLGWDSAIERVTGDKVYTAGYKYVASYTRKYLENNFEFEHYVNDDIEYIGEYAFTNVKTKNLTFNNVKDIGPDAFYRNGFFNVLSFPKAVRVSKSAFYSYSAGGGANTIIIGSEVNEKCVMYGSYGGSNTPCKKMYVNKTYIDAYKSENFMLSSSVISPYYEPYECINLDVTIDDISNGRYYTTTGTYRAECKVTRMGEPYDGTYVFEDKFTVETEPNELYEPVIKTASYTYMNKTTEATYVHNAKTDKFVYFEGSVASNKWIPASDKYHVDGYECYMSDIPESNTDSYPYATAKFTFYGYSEFTIYIRANHSSSYYAYVNASVINPSGVPQGYNDSKTKLTTRGTVSAGTSLSDYKACKYTGLKDGDFIYVVYKQETTLKADAYKGWVLIKDDDWRVE